MDTLFALIFFASLIALPIGLIKPAWIMRREGVSRKKFGVLALLTIFGSAILGATTSTPAENVAGSIEGTATEAVTIEEERTQPLVVAPSELPIPSLEASPSPSPSISPSPSPLPSPSPKTVIKSTPTPTPTPIVTSAPSTYGSTSEVNYYTNVDGNQVQSPTYYDSAPDGATAQCRDGTYSFSQNRRGTCSGHGGVAQWL